MYNFTTKIGASEVNISGASLLLIGKSDDTNCEAEASVRLKWTLDFEVHEYGVKYGSIRIEDLQIEVLVKEWTEGHDIEHDAVICASENPNLEKGEYEIKCEFDFNGSGGFMPREVAIDCFTKTVTIT